MRDRKLSGLYEHEVDALRRERDDLQAERDALMAKWKETRWEMREEMAAIPALKKELETCRDAIQQLGRERDRAHAKAVATEEIVKEARRLIERSATIDEQHPAYGFLVMGIPLAKAIAALDAHCGSCALSTE